MINIAILGYGYWGHNLVRNFHKLFNCNISYIVDKDINKLNEAKLVNIINMQNLFYKIINIC